MKLFSRLNLVLVLAAALFAVPAFAQVGGGVLGSGVTVHGTITPGNCADFFSKSQIEDSGAVCGGGGGGSGTVASSTIGTVPVYTGATTVTGNANFTYSSGAVTVGAAGTQGSLKVKGTTSGTLIITTQGAAGTPTWTAGTSSGTPAVTASSPLVLTTATGDIACATCGVTGTGLGQFASTTSAQLATVLSDETGTGANVFAGSPALTGTVTAAALTLSSTLTTNVTGSTQCLHVNTSGVVSGTGSDCGSGGGGGITVGTTTITSGTDTRALFDDAGVVQESAGFTYVKGTGALTVSGNSTAAAFVPTGSTVPTDGVYLPAANTTAIADRTLIAVSFTNPVSSVDYLAFNGAATASPAYPSVTATGTDTNIGINLVPKGTGDLRFNGVTLASYPTNDSTATGASTGIGASALSGQTGSSAAYNNVAVGYQTMTGTLTTAAIENTAVGFQALKVLTTGPYNTAVGFQAGVALTSGTQNVFMGDFAGLTATTSTNAAGIVAVGYGAMQTTIGQKNSVYVGANAGQSISTASAVAQNTVVGANAFGTGSAIGEDNVAVGYNAMNSGGANSATDKNTAVGSLAGNFIGSGSASNVAVGYSAMLGITGTKITGLSNVAVGDSALLACQGACATNTVVGKSGGAAITTGTGNTIIGSSVGSTTLTTGANNILIGVSSAVTTAASGTSDTLQIGGTSATGGAGSFNITGMGTLATEAANIRGTFAVTDIASDATHTDASVCEDTTTHIFYSGSGTLGVCLGTSSARYKDKIKPIADGVAQIAALKPINYFYIKGRGDNGVKEQYGFLAEDVVKVFPKLVDLDKDGKPNTVDILGMVPVLVHAVQELKADNDNLRMEIENLKHGGR